MGGNGGEVWRGDFISCEGYGIGCLSSEFLFILSPLSSITSVFFFCSFLVFLSRPTFSVLILIYYSFICFKGLTMGNASEPELEVDKFNMTEAITESLVLFEVSSSEEPAIDSPTTTPSTELAEREEVILEVGTERPVEVVTRPGHRNVCQDEVRLICSY
jgi:hypothetical protein